MNIYDKGGSEIDVDTFSALMGNWDYRRVAATEVGTTLVSTVWLGIDHSWGGTGPPLIFETMVFADGNTNAIEQAVMRYSSVEAALAGHEDMVALIGRG